MTQHCDGCLGRRTCWVCLGTGHTDTERRIGECGKCLGTGLCSYCDPSEPTVLDLEMPPERAEIERAIIEALQEAPADDGTAPSVAHTINGE